MVLTGVGKRTFVFGHAPPAAVGSTLHLLPCEPSLVPGRVQRVGVRFGLERRGRALIADEMGVGKTVQAIALAACYRVR